MPYTVMAQAHSCGDRARATESPVSLTAGVTTALNASRLTRRWTALFDQYAGGAE
jgi:hypothetical protein